MPNCGRLPLPDTARQRRALLKAQQTRRESRPLRRGPSFKAWRALADDKTGRLLRRDHPQPAGDILDIEPIAAARGRRGIVDVLTPYLVRPIGGVPTSSSATVPGRPRSQGGDRRLGGCDRLLADASAPARSRPQSMPLSLGPWAARRARVQLLRVLHVGAVTSPSTRSSFHSVVGPCPLNRAPRLNALVARFLEAHPDVESVLRAGSLPTRAGQEVRAAGTGITLYRSSSGRDFSRRAFADGVQLPAGDSPTSGDRRDPSSSTGLDVRS